MNDVLQQLVDESELRKLILELPRCLDTRDWVAVGSLFTEDATFRIAGQTRVGTQAIIDGPRGDIGRMFESTQHHMGNIYLDVKGDEAEIHAYVIAVHIHHTDDRKTHADVGGGYRARARRTDAGWRLAECEVFMSWESGSPFPLH